MAMKLTAEIKAEICTHYEHGMSQVKIASKYLINQSSVSRILKRKRIRGFNTRLSGSGRKRKLSKEYLEFFEQEIKIDPKIGSRKLKITLENEKKIIVSDRNIRRRLCDVGLFGRVACKKPLLTDHNTNSRLEHSKMWLGYDKEEWDRIIWSDETKINLFGSDGRTYVRRKTRSRYNFENLIPTVKHGGGNVLVWGCFSSKGVGEISFINGKMNAEEYCRILDTCLLVSANKLCISDFIFQQDNDPKHTSSTAKEYLDIKKVKTMSWPSQSPDMNPIENIWGILKRKVELRKPTSIRSLKEIIKEEWKAVTKEQCQKLVNGMHERAFKLWSARGKHTKY